VEIWVAGYPSVVGGADTELDHQIDLWRRYDVEVHLVPMPAEPRGMRSSCDARGVHTHAYDPTVFKDKLVVSYCNDAFLKALPEIVRRGRPAQVIWFNCMTWTFPAELEAIEQGWLDRLGFVSAYQERLLRPQLEERGEVVALEGYRPYFNLERAPFAYAPPRDRFVVGRISRPDPSKFSQDMWRIFYKVSAPQPTAVRVLGWSREVQAKCGPPPPDLDVRMWEAGKRAVGDHYRDLHTLIHKTGGSRESYGRIVPECYAHGVPVIVEDDFAFPELVIDGETGFRCQSSDEMSYRASQLAWDEARRRRVAHQAREHLATVLTPSDVCWQAWERVLGRGS
jgi:glycosyltransferase involved in cell wall biosynthesis